MSLNKHALAIKYFDRALKIDHRYAEVHFMKANCLFILAEYRKAINHFNNAVILGEL